MPEWIRKIKDNWGKLTLIFAVPLLVYLAGLYQDEVKNWLNTTHQVKGLILASEIYLIWISTGFAFWMWIDGRKKEKAFKEEIAKMQAAVSAPQIKNDYPPTTLFDALKDKMKSKVNRMDNIFGVIWKWNGENPEKTLKPYCPICERELEEKMIVGETRYTCIGCGQIKSNEGLANNFRNKVLIEIRYRSEQGKYEKKTKST